MKDTSEKNYWDSWYDSSTNSGPGSQGKLQEFKINYLNKLFKQFEIKTVLDFGCGDGSLALGLHCQSYFGIDIAINAIKLCKKRVNRQGFSFECENFFNYTPSIIKNKFPSGLDCCICIDTLYHIFTEQALSETLKSLFSTEAKIVVLYTIPSESLKLPFHPMLRSYGKGFSNALSKFSESFKLVDKTKPTLGSAAGFLVYVRKNNETRCNDVGEK